MLLEKGARAELRSVRVSKETRNIRKRDLLRTQKRPNMCGMRWNTEVSRKTSLIHKRDLLQRQERPVIYAKATYCIQKTDLLHTQKRRSNSGMPVI